jgi:alkylation response protein AidB-like acyl-CoA dehydrogenase
MDFNDTPQETEFREEAKAWLEANAPSAEELQGLDMIEQAKLWQKRKYDAGWACLRWPKEYGGRDASPMEQVIWGQEEAKFDLPGGVFMIGQGMAAPTLMAWGSEEQKSEHLPRLASGEDIWCQLFSEPAGGSDLAALRTRSERDGDDWVINGQKIWTSGAQYSDYGILVTRSDPNVPKHKGLTYFFLDMKSPGIEVRPIKQISGGANFNEVYFTDVRIPDAQRLGAEGQGWQVALTTLMNERAAIGGGGGGGVGGFQQAFELAQKVTIDDRPAIEDRAVRAKLANWYCQESGMRFTGLRSVSALSRGETPGPENSIGKYVSASKSQDIASFCMDLMEMTGAVADPESDSAIYVQSFMGAPGGRIAGGTDEVMLNILAERVLGLPQEPRVDKGIPFSEIPTGKSGS